MRRGREATRLESSRYKRSVCDGWQHAGIQRRIARAGGVFSTGDADSQSQTGYLPGEPFSRPLDPLENPLGDQDTLPDCKWSNTGLLFSSNLYTPIFALDGS